MDLFTVILVEENLSLAAGKPAGNNSEKLELTGNP
jgi:hypothetical protein